MVKVPDNVHLAHMSILEDTWRFDRIRRYSSTTGSGWNHKSIPLNDEDYKDTVMHILKSQGVIVEGKDNYWCYITVNKESSGATLEQLNKLNESHFPWIKLIPYHKSEEFCNGNYFEGNYLQLHIFKLEF